MAPERFPEVGLAERISRLERTNRRLWRVVLALPLASLVWAGSAKLVAAARPSMVEGSQFVLKDSTGAKRGELLIDGDGSGKLILYGADGEVITELPMRPRAFPLQR